MLSKMCLLKRRVCRIFAKDHFCRCSVGKESCAWIHSKLLQRSFKNTLLYYVDRCRLPISMQNHDYIMCFHFKNVLLRVITVRMCFFVANQIKEMYMKLSFHLCRRYCKNNYIFMCELLVIRWTWSCSRINWSSWWTVGSGTVYNWRLTALLWQNRLLW